jgi:hypothetical protein
MRFLNIYIERGASHQVSVLNGRQTMGNGNCRASLCGLVKSGLYDPLGIRIQGRCCLVEQKNLRIAEKSTGNGNTFYKSLHEHPQAYKP